MQALIFRIFTGLVLLAFATDLLAWGNDGHRIVGALAMQQLDATAATGLEEILGSTSREQMDYACTWPDVVRPSPEWQFTYRWHYVNLPRWATDYDRDRDCSHGECSVERIKWAADRLGNERFTNTQREQAFNFLCHFVGDIHQPMHTGYAADRGGNDHAVEYRGQSTDLHTLWDHDILERHHPSWQKYAGELSGNLNPVPVGPWSPAYVDCWAGEAFANVKSWFYPPKSRISNSYEKRALPFIDQQLLLAGQRLAWIVNSVLGNGTVELEADCDRP